jgi:hypothetical protein
VLHQIVVLLHGSKLKKSLVYLGLRCQQLFNGYFIFFLMVFLSAGRIFGFANGGLIPAKVSYVLVYTGFILALAGFVLIHANSLAAPADFVLAHIGSIPVLKGSVLALTNFVFVPASSMFVLAGSVIR